MRLALTDDQTELRGLVRAFCADTQPTTEVRRLMDTEAGYDRALWRRFATELGLTGLAVPEAYGGAGQTFAEVAIVAEELGRHLACLPYLSTTVLACSALLACDDEEARAAYLPSVAAGELTATLAVGGDITADGTVLSGTVDLVVDGHTADLLLVSTPDGGLYAVDGEAADRTALPVLDRTRPLARVIFDAAPARPVHGGDVVRRVSDLVAVALAAEMAGGARAALEMAVDYAKVREQFGRPIGAYQAVKHNCAELLVDVEAAASAAAYARWAAGTEAAELPEAASLAKAYCGDAFVRVATENIHIHGGIGFTWEHDAHLYFRRATASRTLFGTSDHHRDLLAASLPRS